MRGKETKIQIKPEPDIGVRERLRQPDRHVPRDIRVDQPDTAAGLVPAGAVYAAPVSHFRVCRVS